MSCHVKKRKKGKKIYTDKRRTREKIKIKILFVGKKFQKRFTELVIRKKFSK